MTYGFKVHTFPSQKICIHTKCMAKDGKEYAFTHLSLNTREYMEKEKEEDEDDEIGEKDDEEERR